MAQSLKSLKSLEKTANEEHHAAVSSAEDAVEHARKSGAALNQIKGSVVHGRWGAWLAEHFQGSERQAQKYMQLATRWEQIEERPKTIKAALKELSEPKEQEDSKKTEESSKAPPEADLPLTGSEGGFDEGCSDFPEESDKQNAPAPGGKGKPAKQGGEDDPAPGWSDGKDLAKLIQQAKQKVSELQEGHPWMREQRKTIEDHLIDARKLLLGMEPKRHKKCEGKGCKDCRKMGWIPASLAKRLPEDMR